MSEPIAVAHVTHLLPGFVVGTLGPDERRGVLSHLTDCPACSAELAAWRTIQDALREPPPNLPADDTTMHEVWRRLDAVPLPPVPRLATHKNGNARPPGNQPRAAVQPERPLLPTAHAPLSIPAAAAASRPRWSPAPFLFATMLLLAVIGLGALALGPGRVHLDQFVPRANVHTLEAPGLVGAESEETLVEMALPATLAPAGERVRSYLSHIVIPPRTSSTWDATDAACCHGMRLTYVLQGTYAVWPEGPAQVIRADGAKASAPAGSEMLLAAGDTIVLGSDTPFAADNPSESPTELLQVFFAYPATFPRGTNTLADWNEHHYDMQDIRWQGGTAAVRLSQLVLAPNAVLFGPADTTLMQVTMPADGGEDGIPPQRMTVSQPNGEIKDGLKNLGREPATLYVLSLKQGGATLMP